MLQAFTPTFSSSSQILATGTTKLRAIGDRLADAINAKDFGALGNGSADDTAALQAAINHCLASGHNLFLPAGIYLISSPLTIGNGGTNYARGFAMSGAGKTGQGGPCGTVIQMTAAAQGSIITVNRDGGWRYCKIEELALTCSNASHPSYGILFASSEFSQPTLRRIEIDSVGICIGVLVGTGVNGEFGLIDDCALSGDNGIFYTTAGQGFSWTFRHCAAATVNSGAIGFDLEYTNGGFGLQLLDTSGTFGQVNGIANSTLIKSNLSSTAVNVIGGRYENVTKLLSHLPVGNNFDSVFNFEGLDLNCDFDPTNAHNTTNGFFDVSGSAVISMQRCGINASLDNGTQTAPILVNANGAPGPRIRFEDNLWEGFASVPSTLDNMSMADVEIDDRVQVAGASVGAVGDYGFSIAGTGVSILGRRRASSRAGRAAAGTPSNIIVAPEIATANGSSVTPGSPWTLSGAASIQAYDATQAANRPTSQSQFSKRIVLAPGATLSQTLTALDLSSSTNAWCQQYTANFIGWQMLAAVAGGSAQFSITDSASGQVYDKQTIGADATPPDPMLITLSRQIAVSGASRHPVINITNPSSSVFLTLDIWWQFASYYPNPAWSDSTSAAAILGRSYDLVAQSALVASELGVPVVADAMRLTNANYVQELGAQIYASRDQNRMVEQTPDLKWWVRPRATTGTAAPTSGTWVQGDLVFNTADATGGPLGWVCVAGGTPGTWESFGVVGAVQSATFNALTDSTGGTVGTTLASIAAGATYSQSDMVAVKNALASIAAELNLRRMNLRSANLVA